MSMLLSQPHNPSSVYHISAQLPVPVSHYLLMLFEITDVADEFNEFYKQNVLPHVVQEKEFTHVHVCVLPCISM